MASNTPKTMSTRLLTMKFMQRAAASPSSPSTPHSEDEPSPKRRKKFGQSPAPAATATQSLVNPAAVQAARDEEERKRQAAIAKQAAELGDTRWVLDLPAAPTRSGKTPQTPLNVVQIGFAQIDAADTAGAAGGGLIRRFNMKQQRRETQAQAQARNQSSSSSSPLPSLSSQPAALELTLQVKQQQKTRHDNNHDTESGSSDDDSGSDDSNDGGDHNDASYSSPAPAAAGKAPAVRGRQPVNDYSDAGVSSNNSKRKRGMSEMSSSRRSVERAKAQEFSAKRRKKEVKLNGRQPAPVGISANSFRPRAASNRGGGGHGGGGFR